jgi:hypothetical protein
MAMRLSALIVFQKVDLFLFEVGGGISRRLGSIWASTATDYFLCIQWVGTDRGKALIMYLFYINKVKIELTSTYLQPRYMNAQK